MLGPHPFRGAPLATQEGLIHLHCGDAAAAVHRRSGLPGVVLVWRDSPAVGPWVSERSRLGALRASWWGVPAAEAGGPDSIPDPVTEAEPVLWFGPDPWEQACLLWVLAELREDALPDLVPLDQGVGQMAPGSLPSRFAQRGLLEAHILREARGLWSRYLEGGWRALGGRGLPGLPHLASALARLAEDHPAQGPGRTRRQIQTLLDRGIRDLPGLMAGLRVLEDPRHGAWYGDLFVAKMADAMGVRLG